MLFKYVPISSVYHKSRAATRGQQKSNISIHLIFCWLFVQDAVQILKVFAHQQPEHIHIILPISQYIKKTIKILFWRIPKIRSTTYLSLSTSILISTRPWGDCRCHTFGILRWMLRLLGFWEILPWRFLREGTHRNKWWDNDWYDWFTGHRDFMGYDMMVINRDLANKNGDIECVCPVVLISSVCELENHHIFTW